MDLLLHGYAVNRPTWFYLSTILILAVYFRFNRWWSLRNLDLLLILSASPGLVFLHESVPQLHRLGYGWLYVISCLFLVRLLIDPLLQRRPYLGQNMNTQGLGFLCLAVFAFIMTQAVTETLPMSSHQTVQKAGQLLSRTATEPEKPDDQGLSPGPAAPLLAAPVGLVFEDLAARILAILAHAAVIVGLWFVGRNLFADASLGLGMATLYLLLPCTAYNVGEFNHVLPTALIVWAFVAYRKPVVSGILLGLACGTMYFPILLLPMWAAFYGRKGAWRFAMALVLVAAVLTASLALTSADPDSFFRKTLGSIDLAVLAFHGGENTIGFWREADYLSVYRIPIMVAYAVMLVMMSIWPRRRSVETLLAQSCAVIVGTQLWFTQQGGVYLLWYLPIMLMIVFRPRLMQVSFPEDSETLPDVGANSRAGAQAGIGARGKNIQVFR
ncbi:MAG: DUF2029 domain-containing protein [Planctomycetaceae bacterium]|nr:DUF2029 domain-containing protein [Planctomycetaceae bacterium]